MKHRIVALAVASVLVTAVSATAVSATAVSATTTPPRAPDGAGPPPPGRTPPPRPTPPPGTGSSGEAWAWTQLTSHGTQIRYVSTDTSQTCPSVRYTLGTQMTVPLQRVSTPVGAHFPTTVCESGSQTPVPLGASNAHLLPGTVQAATLHPTGGHLPLPTWTTTTRPGTIDVIGDTGCELPVNPADPAQHCATAWPFKPIADSVARAAPDLVIHTGDYLYRNDPGRADDKARNPGCTMRTDASSWACVVADFFRPAEALLAAAPVALTRGNHEDCTQPGGAGDAWFRYLADELRNGSCSRFPPPATIRAGTLNLVSVDSSSADDSGTAQVNTYARQFDIVNQAAQQRSSEDFFVVTHKPVWMVKAAGQAQGAVEWATHVLDDAVAHTSLGRLANNVRLALSGHIHLYQMLDFNTRRPPQLTVGSSGGPLDDGPIDSNAMRQQIGTPGQTVHNARTQEEAPTATPPRLGGVFGYGQLHHNNGTWDLTFHRTDGSVRGQTCTLSTSLTNKSFSCH
ncbi:metallophosphoesterase [Streptomyces sp. NPDC101165]|uniref:metallophosphoesterase n=1 Tax=Streptomyces sp. NPDC101165 TaxID=3366119 RepID=UPI0038226E8F